MALIELECNLENLCEYFKRDSFQEITEAIHTTSAISRLVMKKYLHPKYKNDIIFNGNKYLTGKYIEIADLVFFDTLTQDLLLGVKDKTIHIQHIKPKKKTKSELLSKETRHYVEKQIDKSRRLKGISLADQVVIDTLRFHYPNDAYQHKWLCDLDYVYNSPLFVYAKNSSFIPKFAIIEDKKRLILLYTNMNKELINGLKPRYVYRSNNKEMMNKIPNLVKRGDTIHRIIRCNMGIAVEKETMVTWFIHD